MTIPLGGFLALLGALGFGAFLLHLRQIATAVPQLVLVVLILLTGVGLLGGLLFARRLSTGWWRLRSTALVAVLAIFVATVFAVGGALLQMAGVFAMAYALPVEYLDYGSMGIAATRLLVPSFFAVLHCLLCFLLAITGLRRRSTPLLSTGVFVSALTLCVLVGYARVPL